MRLIDADALLDALPKDDVLLSCDVRRIILDQQERAAIPREYHERCMELAEAGKIKLAKALKMAQETNRRILANYRPVVHAHWETYDTGMHTPEASGRHRCSNCKRPALEWHMREELSAYCYCCGAEMDGEGKDHD